MLTKFEGQARAFATFLAAVKHDHRSDWSYRHTTLSHRASQIDVSFYSPNGECGEWCTFELPVAVLFDSVAAIMAFHEIKTQMQVATRERQMNQLRDRQQQRIEDEARERAQYEILKQKFGDDE
ncbi:hypothetical protein AHP1_181 [Aeromonas phage Ahp1_CNU-2021]|nr:hypothetical protein AHP1_181 [Aeromonas phage Ahp1_CNU-2021]